jgi:hypothetical protein
MDLVGFTIGMYYDARTYERRKSKAHYISSFRKYLNVLHTRTGQPQHTVLRLVGLEVKADTASFKFSSRHHNA